MPDMKALKKFNPIAWLSGEAKSLKKVQGASLKAAVAAGKKFGTFEGELKEGDDVENGMATKDGLDTGNDNETEAEEDEDEEDEEDPIYSPDEFDRLGYGEKWFRHTVTTEQLFFVLLYPNVKTLQKRAERDKTSILLNARKLNETFESFIEKQRYNPNIINFKRFGVTAEEWDEFYTNEKYDSYFQKFNPTRKRYTAEEYEALPLEQVDKNICSVDIIYIFGSFLTNELIS